MRLWQIGLAGALALGASMASAADTSSCASANICASDPQGIVKELTKTGYKPDLQTDEDGDPMILVTTPDGLNTFNIYFYGCVAAKQCDSLMFRTTADPNPNFSLELANAWNDAERFTQGYIDLNTGVFAVEYDMSTQGGGVNKSAFNDTVSRYVTNMEMLAQVIQTINSGTVPVRPTPPAPHRHKR